MEREPRAVCKICDGAGEALLQLNLPTDAISIQDKWCCGAGTNMYSPPPPL